MTLDEVYALSCQVTARNIAATRGRAVAYIPQHPGSAAYVDWDGFEFKAALGDVVNSDLWLAYPSGLSIPIQAYCAVWAFPGIRQVYDYRIGTADQAWRMCRYWNVDPEWVGAVPEEDMHGTCVLEGWGNPDGVVGWQLVQAHSFPTWSQR